MDKNDIDNNLKDYISKLTKFLTKEKETFKVYNEDLYDSLSNSKYQIIILTNDSVYFDDFIKTFFIGINTYNNFKEKKIFLRLSYKIFAFLNNTKIKINIHFDNILKCYLESFISNLNNILNNETELKNESKFQKYFLSYIEFTIKYIVSNLTLKYNFLLIQVLFNLNGIFKEVKLRDKCKHLILRICDNIEFKIMKKIEEYYAMNSNDDNYKLIKDSLRFYNEEYDISFYNYEFLKCKDIVENLVDNICLYEKKYITMLKSSNLSQINSVPNFPVRCIPDKNNIEKYKSIKMVPTHNEKNVISGRFGWCNFCRNTAEFYCIISRLPVCSLGCKNKILFREKFSENWETLINFNSIIFQEFHKDIEEFINELCSKLIEEDYAVNSQNSFKLKFEMVLKFFKILSCCLTTESFENIKKNLIKVLGKFIYFGDYVIVSISLNILLVINKKFGNLIKNEMKFIILDIFLKIFETNEYYKVNLVIKYLNQIFNTNYLENFLLFHSNFDLLLYQPDLNKILIDSLFKILKDNNKDKQIKLKTISFLNKILLSLIKFCFVNCNLISSKLFKLTDKDKTSIKDSLYICRDKFNHKPKDIVSHIEESLDFNSLLCFNEGEAFTTEEKRNRTIIHILRNCYGIDKEKIGDFLSEPKDISKVLLNQFMATFNFKNTHIIEALRKLLFCIKLPGEAQKIDRFMESFAKKFHNDNSTIFENSDPLYYLCFSIIMLQTDMHNPNVKKKMSVNDYIKNLVGQNNGKNFDSQFLEDIYETLKKKPFLFFNYDNSNNNQLTQNDDITIKNFYMNIDLSEKEDWKLNINKNDLYYISKMFFQIFFMEFESLYLENMDSGVEFYKYLYLIIFNYIELLNFLHLKNERISLIHFIIKVLSKDANLNLKKLNLSMAKFISSFVEIITKKSQLFYGTWINTIKFIFYYYNNLLKILLDKNLITDDETRQVVCYLCEVFKKEKIENYFSFAAKFNVENFVDIINCFLFNLKNYHQENTNSTTLLIINVIKKLMSNFNKNNDVWASILTSLNEYITYIFKEKIEKEVYERMYDLIRFNLYLLMEEVKQNKTDLSAIYNKFCETLFNIFSNEYINNNDKSALLTEFNNFLKSNLLSNDFLKFTNIIVMINLNMKENTNNQIFSKYVEIVKSIVYDNINEKILYSKSLFKIILKIFDNDFESYKKIMKDILSSHLSFLADFEELMTNHFKKLVTKDKLVNQSNKRNFLSFMFDFLNLTKFLNFKHVQNNYTIISSRLVYFLELIYEISLLEKVNNSNTIISKDMIDNFIQIFDNQDKNIIEICFNKILKVFYKLIDINSKSLHSCKNMLTFLIKLFNKHLSNYSEQIESLYEIFKLLNNFFVENFLSENHKTIENAISNRFLETTSNFHYLIKHLILQLRENIILIIDNFTKNNKLIIDYDVALRTHSILRELIVTHYNVNFVVLRKLLVKNKENKLTDVLFLNSANIYFQRLILTNYYSVFTYILIKQKENEKLKNEIIKLFFEVFDDLQQHMPFIRQLQSDSYSILEFYNLLAQSFLLIVKIIKNNNKTFDKKMKLSILDYLMLDDNSLRLTLKNILYEIISYED